MIPPVLTVAGLAAAYRDADGPTPVDVVEDVLQRIAANDGDVGAMVTVTAELARRDARQAATRLGDGDPSPLLGVPVVVKDLIDVAGVPTTAGSRVLAGQVAVEDAVVWQRLRAAGAVLVGKANTHEFAYGGTTEPTRNPWNLARMVGGSSGGSAAALAAGYCAAAIGTDTAGSIRIPAALCGVTGLKPTHGRWDVNGIIPLSTSLDVVGPLAHTARDCHLVSLALDGRAGAVDDADAGLRSVSDELRAGRLRVGVLTGLGPIHPDVQRLLDEAVGALSAAGAHCSNVTIEELQDALGANFTILGAEAARYHRRFAAQRELYTPYVRERLDEAARVTEEQEAAARGLAARLRVRIDTAFDAFDVLLGPSVPVPAPIAYVDEVEVDGSLEARDGMLCRNLAFTNLTGHPATTIPVGLVDGLPVAAHLVGPRSGDDRLLAISEFALQAGGWQPRSPLGA